MSENQVDEQGADALASSGVGRTARDTAANIVTRLREKRA